MDPLRISLVQFDIAWEDPIANRLKLDLLMDPLKGKTDIILLPEMFTTGFSMNARELSETMDGITVKWMQEMASVTGAAIAGSLIINENSHYFNRFLFVTPEGEIFSYDKRHLFSIGGENLCFTPGNKRVVINYSGWKIALLICYDLRFPVWSRTAGDADLMLYAANWPQSRKIVWETLLRARAIENQVYTAGVSRTGTDGTGVLYFGGSMVIDPKGELLIGLSDLSDKAGTITLSLKQLNSFRKKFPVSLDADSFQIAD
jgi:predicted amidohydrolase